METFDYFYVSRSFKSIGDLFTEPPKYYFFHSLNFYIFSPKRAAKFNIARGSLAYY